MTMVDIPRTDDVQPTPSPLVRIRNLRKYYSGRSGVRALYSGAAKHQVRAVDDVSFDIMQGEILGLIGESGSGKTTIGKLVMALEVPESGSELIVDGVDLLALRRADHKAYYRKIQMVFQDPFESINPRFTILETIAELIKVQQLGKPKDHEKMAIEVLEACGLRPAVSFLRKYPHELSGGERQRLSIARALVVNPKILVADEPVSMLDVSIKAGILNLLKDASDRLGLTILYVSHDLSTVKYLCDRAVIVYHGKMVEIGPADRLIDDPLHPYAKALKNSIPIPDPEFKRQRGVAEAGQEKAEVTVGCIYQHTCSLVMAKCRSEAPEMEEVRPGRQVACHLMRKEVA
jgi:peptide/nickel transport system ATP-binding protein